MIELPKNALKGAGPSVYINNSGKLVNNATTLRHDEGKAYDTALMETVKQRLRLSSLFIEKGLTFNLGGLGTIISMYERVGDMTRANVSMDGRTRADQDIVTLDEVGVPVPIFHKEFEINTRHLLASRSSPGADIDTTNLVAATRVVAEEWESHIVNGLPNIQVGGLKVYGLITHPNRKTKTLANNWSTATGVQITADINSMLAQMYASKHYGPFTLILDAGAWANIQNDYSATKGDNTVLDRILAFQDISDVIPAEFMPAGNHVLVEMNRTTVDLAIAQEMDYVEWMTQPFGTEYKVFQAGVVRIKADKDGNSGIIHASNA